MTAKIASIHFAPVHADRSIYGGVYDIPAVPLGAEPFVLDIEDKVQYDEGPFTLGTGGGRAKLMYAVDRYDICFDIVRHWTENSSAMTPACHPGIWVVRDRLPVYRANEYGKEEAVLDGFKKQVFRTANAEEQAEMWTEDLARARATDRAYAEWCYLDGNRMAANVNMVPLIPPNYKRAARHYGFQADWLKEGAAFEVTKCPMCDKVVSKATIVCPHCQQVVDLQRFAEREAEKAAAIRAAVNKSMPMPAEIAHRAALGMRNKPTEPSNAGA